MQGPLYHRTNLRAKHRRTGIDTILLLCAKLHLDQRPKVRHADFDIRQGGEQSLTHHRKNLSEQNTDSTNTKWDLMKLKIFCTAKATVIWTKQQTRDEEKIFTNYTLNRCLICKIYEELKTKKPGHQENKEPSVKMGYRPKQNSQRENSNG